MFDVTFGLAGYLPGAIGSAAGMGLPFAAHALGPDGTWDNGRDSGLVFGAGDGAAAGAVRLHQMPGAAAEAVAARAGKGFGLTSDILGVPRPPISPTWSWQRAAVEGAPLPLGANDLIEHDLDELGLLPK